MRLKSDSKLQEQVIAQKVKVKLGSRNGSL